MKFDFIIGNPPYQIEQNGRMLPIYHNFMDEVYELGDKCELITPGRFLFNAGQTGEDWNTKILNDPHFKVLEYEPDSKKVFSGVDIKGGVAITFHDKTQLFDPIQNFVAYDDLRTALNKVLCHESFVSIFDKVFTSTKYNLKEIYKDHPEYSKFVKSDGKHSQIDTNAFSKMPIFVENKPEGEEVVQLYGRNNNQREYRWVLRRYVVDSGNLDKYKVFISKANGTGAFETLSSPMIGEPKIGSTQSFLSIGCEESLEAAENILKYLKGKFSRAMLGTLKITQDNSAIKWKNVPLQDFSSNSDIDWSKTIHDIDEQLYIKYGLDNHEIEFIESHVKEME